ncbi:hypothetical protein PR048_013824 [Dryococelus australis]|uniref:Integrase zinc-binding domain-containing protein n=1 Tax=Dryococelus australis TaxID=614101 RepID=A0ABQ9HTA3_9NEOP|nr:hypothetical protein PR048_013824 [Dryococelus australis]
MEKCYTLVPPYDAKRTHEHSKIALQDLLSGQDKIGDQGWDKLVRDQHQGKELENWMQEHSEQCLVDKYWWPGVEINVGIYAIPCTICIICKSHPTAHSAPRAQRPMQPWIVIVLDLMEPYPWSKKGNHFRLVITDKFYCWTEVTPLKHYGKRPVKEGGETYGNPWTPPSA